MPRHRSLLLGAASLAALSILTACTAVSSSRDEERVWSLASIEEGSRALLDAERELDALLAHEVGLDETMGVSADEAAQSLPRADATTANLADSLEPADGREGTSVVAASFGTNSPAIAIPAAYPVPQPDTETVGAADP
jgi:hypothetical protein